MEAEFQGEGGEGELGEEEEGAELVPAEADGEVAKGRRDDREEPGDESLAMFGTATRESEGGEGAGGGGEEGTKDGGGDLARE